MTSDHSISLNPDSDNMPKMVKTVRTLIIVKLVLSMIFYIVFVTQGLQVGHVGPQIISYTAIAFAVLLVPQLILINKRKIWPLRAVMFLDLLAALPATAIISILLSVISIGLTFTKSFRNYFSV